MKTPTSNSLAFFYRTLLKSEVAEIKAKELVRGIGQAVSRSAP